MLKLHLGCGYRDFGKNWIHIDGCNASHLHSHDIVDLPFENNSVDIIYSSHVIEYFSRTEVSNLLYKWYDKLKFGGTLRLAVPDFESMARLYLNGLQLDRILGPLYGEMHMDGKKIYHKTVYDFISLKKILELVGFKNVSRYNWRETDHGHIDDHSQAYIPHMDKDNGTLISLNVECIK